MRVTPWPWILVLATLWPQVASAHRIGLSSARIFVDGGAIESEIVVKGSDLEVALGIALVDAEQDLVLAEALVAHGEALVAHLLAHVTLWRGDGIACAGAPDAPEADADGVVFWIVWDCGADPDPVIYRNTLFHAANPLAIQNVMLMRGEEVVQDVLTSQHRELALTATPPPSLARVFLRYTGSGITHIAIGYDHIAFLVALLLWARRLLPIVKVVTAFTIAHSITLALAVLDVVTIPASVVEPLIAGTIIWVAVENLFWRDIGRRWRITFMLGLVHGFGFAAVLREFGLPGDALAMALAAFNIGVEIGQVAIVSIAVPLLLGIDRLMRADGRSPRLVHAASLVIAGLGLYWLLVRTDIV